MTRARKFLRVSSDNQKERNQIDDVIRFIAARGYDDDGKDYLAHGKSAYRGKHLPLLLKAIEDMAHGEYDVLVLWDSSRFTRMGAESIFDLMRRAREAGGSIQFAASHAQGLNQASDWAPVMLALQATADKLESDRKRAHTKRDIARHQEAGSIHGKPSWGFEVVGEKDEKRFVPTAEGRQWIPWMYEQAINGKGAVQIARMLTDAGVGGKRWNEGVVNHLLRNPVHHGARRSGGNLEVEALVPFSTWQEAIAALESRRRAGREATKHEPALLKPICAVCFGQIREGCSNGLSVMYLQRYKDGWNAFRCSGAGSLRKGCGAPLVPQEELEAIVFDRYATHPQRHMERRWVPGVDTDAALRDLNRQISEAASMGDYGRVAELSTQAAEMGKTEARRGHWGLVDSGRTRGDYFRSLSREDQRAFIAQDTIVAERRDGVVLVAEVLWNDEWEDGSPTYVVAPWQ